MSQFPARLRFVFALLTCLCTLAGPASVRANVTSGVEGDRPRADIRDIVVDPSTAGVVYIATAGALYKSTDAADHWVRLTDGPSLQWPTSTTVNTGFVGDRGVGSADAVSRGSVRAS